VQEKRLAWERLLPIAILCATAALVPVLVWSDAGLPKLSRLRMERDAVREKSSRLELEIRQLQAEVERIKTDPVAVERTARDELGLIRQTEVVFQFQH
jgi:cell division protein FtsB